MGRAGLDRPPVTRPQINFWLLQPRQSRLSGAPLFFSRPVQGADKPDKISDALKEIRACLEAEMLTDVQQRLALLSRDMDNHNGQRIPHQPAFSRS